MDSSSTIAMIIAERALREREIVAAPEPVADFTMNSRPSTIEAWLGEKHGAGE